MSEVPEISRGSALPPHYPRGFGLPLDPEQGGEPVYRTRERGERVGLLWRSKALAERHAAKYESDWAEVLVEKTELTTDGWPPHIEALGPFYFEDVYLEDL